MLDRVTRVVNFAAFRDKALAAFLATAAQNVTTVGRFHAGTEPELALAGPFGRLVSAFAHV